MNTNRIAVLGALLLFVSYIFLQLHLDEQHRGHHRLVRRAVSRDSVLSCASVSCLHGVYVGCNTTGGRDRCVCYGDTAGNGFWAGAACDHCAPFYFGANCSVFCNPNVTCHNRGTCDAKNGSCVCEADYLGSQCDRRTYPADAKRRDAVKAEMAHSWKGYRRYAFGHDELMPVSKEFKDWAVDGFGLTLIDSLDTLYIMGMTAEYEEARAWVANKFDIKKDGTISVFECTIRVVGGLLGAYTLTHDGIFLKRAGEVVEMLLPAFTMYPNGIPASQINPATGEMNNNDWARGLSVLSEFGTLQLEFNYLANITDNPSVRLVTDKIMDLLRKAEDREADMGLFPVYFDGSLGHFTQSMETMGGMSDSYYEYLLKQWVQDGHRHPFALGMYQRAMEGMKKYLVGRSEKYVFLMQRMGEATRYRMDQLACFVPGMLILGLIHGAEKSPDETFKLASELMDTCIHMYEFTTTGLSPEDVSFEDNEMVCGAKFYMLRPETVESLFYMWRYTHDEKYRNAGWKIFESMRKHCRVASGGYSGYRNVLIVNWDEAVKYDIEEGQDKHTNAMDSFWIAETLKYMYLLFSEDDLMDLQKVVFNTEAHPFPIWWK